jgi:para-aminobenzoate synthetase component 1
VTSLASLLDALPLQSLPHLLDPRAAGGWGRAVLGAHPEVTFRGGLEALREAERWLGQFRGAPPLSAVLIGSLGYELGEELSGGRVPRRELEVPPVCLAGFRALLVDDPASGSATVTGGCPRARARLEDLVAGLPASRPAKLPALRAARARPPHSEFLCAVRRIQAYIRSGDVYQVNLARRLDLPAPDALGLRRLYQQLAETAAAPFSAYLEGPERTLLSSSPELFLRADPLGVETHPIKGTRPRGATPAEDAERLRELLASEKDRAEHVMIVDLERNDLGRVCETGSVHVPELCAPRSFADVHHLVSVVRGRLRDPADWVGLLEATFPGGSITGAPKLRAMQIIAELEPVPRDAYTGAVGWIDASGRLELAIAIRTAIAAGGALHLHLGGGIVADSDPASELRETRDKGRGFARAWGLEG